MSLSDHILEILQSGGLALPVQALVGHDAGRTITTAIAGQPVDLRLFGYNPVGQVLLQHRLGQVLQKPALEHEYARNLLLSSLCTALKVDTADQAAVDDASNTLDNLISGGKAKGDTLAWLKDNQDQINEYKAAYSDLPSEDEIFLCSLALFVGYRSDWSYIDLLPQASQVEILAIASLMAREQEGDRSSETVEPETDPGQTDKVKKLLSLLRSPSNL